MERVLFFNPTSMRTGRTSPDISEAFLTGQGSRQRSLRGPEFQSGSMLATGSSLFGGLLVSSPSFPFSYCRSRSVIGSRLENTVVPHSPSPVHGHQ